MTSKPSPKPAEFVITGSTPAAGQADSRRIHRSTCPKVTGRAATPTEAQLRNAKPATCCKPAPAITRYLAALPPREDIAAAAARQTKVDKRKAGELPARKPRGGKDGGAAKAAAREATLTAKFPADPGHPGYVIRWPHGAYHLSKYVGTETGRSPWLVVCQHDHHVEAQNTREADQLGVKRSTWCADCKTQPRASKVTGTSQADARAARKAEREAAAKAKVDALMAALNKPKAKQQLASAASTGPLSELLP